MSLVNLETGGFLVVGSCVLLSCMGFVGEDVVVLSAGVDSGVLVEDAGRDDAGLADSGEVSDAGVEVDAGSPDAGAPDAGPPTRAVFVIGGQDMRRLVSFDGVTWFTDTWVAPNGEDNAFSGIAIGKRGIVMSGDPGVFRSTDGLAWTLVQARPSRFAFHGSTMAFADGQFVMLGQDLAWRSLDGITWESQQDTPGASGHWHALAFGNGHWVGLGDGKRKISENGFDWHDPTAFAMGLFEDVAFGAGRFVAVGKEAVDGGFGGWVSTSVDGQNWTHSATLPTPYDTGLSTVGFGNGVFVTSTCCSTLQSVDGITWTQRTTNGSGGELAFAGDRFVTVGWRTEASVLTPDAGNFVKTFTGDRPNPYDDAGIAPWFTAVGAGEL